MRPHAELIKRWLDDETVEIEHLSEHLSSCDEWVPLLHPSWYPWGKYREKPKAKKMVSKWLWAIQIGEETMQTVYFCADKEEVLKRYSKTTVVLFRIENSKIEVEE